MAQQTFQVKNIYRDFDPSMEINPLTGDLSIKKDENAIIQSIKNLLNTNYLERPFRPEVGSNLRGLLFELSDPLAISNIKQAIKESITNYEPRVIVNDVYVEDLSDMNAYRIELYFTMQNVIEPKKIEITLKRLR